MEAAASAPRAWAYLTRAETVDFLSSTLGISPEDEAKCKKPVVLAMQNLAGYLADRCRKENDDSVLWFRQESNKLWGIMSQRFRIPRDKLDMRRVTEEIQRQKTGQLRARAAMELLAKAVFKWWRPKTWRDVPLSGIKSVASHWSKQRAKTMPADWCTSFKKTTEAVEAMAAGRTSFSEVCRDLTRRQRCFLGIACFLHKKMGESAFGVLYRERAPLVSGSPCTFREARRFGRAFADRVSRATETQCSNCMSASRLVDSFNGVIVVSTPSSLYFPATDEVDGRYGGGIVCPVPGRSELVLVHPSGKITALTLSVDDTNTKITLEPVAEMTVQAKSPIDWATVEMDGEANLFLLYGDRDPHRGCPTDSQVSGGLGTAFLPLGPVYGQKDDVEESAIEKTCRRMNGDFEVLDLSVQGNSVASVSRDRPADEARSWTRKLNRVCTVNHGPNVLKTYQGADKILAAWGTPAGWVEVWDSGSIRFAGIGDEERTWRKCRRLEGCTKASVGIVRCESAVYGQSVIGL